MDVASGINGWRSLSCCQPLRCSCCCWPRQSSHGKHICPCCSCCCRWKGRCQAHASESSKFFHSRSKLHIGERATTSQAPDERSSSSPTHCPRPTRRRSQGTLQDWEYYDRLSQIPTTTHRLNFSVIATKRQSPNLACRRSKRSPVLQRKLGEE